MAALLIPSAPGGFFQTFQTDLSNQIGVLWLYLFRFAADHFHGLKLFRSDSLAILCFDFFDGFNAQRILLVAVGQGIPHQIFENVFFYQKGSSFGNLQHIAVVGEKLQGIHVGVQLKIQTAFQTAALSAQFGLVDA